MSSSMPNTYHVGVICPLKIELAAMRAMLDEEHGRFDGQDANDHNVYFAGRIHKHNVVIACLPAGIDGIAAAATAAKDMVRTFPQLRFGLLVGIGGGIPDLARGIDIRLGDVVVGQPQGVYGGVVQYDKGKGRPDSVWERKGSLNAPPTFLLTALQSLQAEHELNDSQIPFYLTQMAKDRPEMITRGYAYPGIDNDVFETCEDLSLANSKKRKRHTRDVRPNTNPVIHYGTIASGNTVVKDALLRDSIRDECGALCVEMEAAGLVNEFPCVVIRGISDYANKFKNDIWHRYAAVTAAAYAKELLLHVSARHVAAEQPMEQIIDTIKLQSKKTVDLILSQEEQRLHQNCHQALYTSTYAEYKELNRMAVQGTCQWVLQHPKFIQWYENSADTLLWISADPGCGKSVLSRYLIDVILCAESDSMSIEYNPHSICYFFFKDNSNQDSLSTALSAVLHQLFLQQPDLIRYAVSTYKTSGHQFTGDAGQLWNILLNAARDPNARSISIVFDGLDECRVTDRKRLVELLCRFYDARGRALSAGGGMLKFLVTSRPYDDIQNAFQDVPPDLPSIRLRGEDENDQIHEEINIVIENYMVDLTRELRLSPRNAHRIKQKLLEMENRTYLWLYLVIDHIKTTFRRSLRPDRESIILLPRSVDEAYEQLLLRVENDNAGEQVKVIFSIILGSRRALSIREMALALDIATDPSAISSLAHFSIDPDRLKENICQWCGLFIFINHGYIYLLHQTAKEFLLRYGMENTLATWRWKKCIHQLEVEKLMAHVCVTYLNVREFNQEMLSYWMKSRDIGVYTRNRLPRREREAGNRFEKFATMKSLGINEEFIESAVSFFEYAAKYWASHIRHVEQTINMSIRQQYIELYDCSSLRFRRINHITSSHNIEGDSYHSHAILLAASSGHSLGLDHLLQSPLDLDTKEMNSRKTALIIAAEQGHANAVRVLLDKGANAEIRFGRGQTALSVAAHKGYFDIVQMLCTERSFAALDLGMAFTAALERINVSILTFLLDSGMDMNMTLDGWGLPLNREESRKDDSLATRLQQAGLSLIGYRDWGTPLHMAVWKGDLHLVNELISRGADVNAECPKTGSVLRTACLVNDEEMIQILWDKGAGSVTTSSKRLFTDIDAFLTAITYSSLEVVRKFITGGIDINKESHDGRHALEAGSSRGDENIARLLLDSGANVNDPGSNYSPALIAAAEQGHEEVVTMLVTHGADVTAECGWDALHAASAHNRIQVVRFLLEAGVDVDAPGQQFSTPLHTAAFHGHTRIAELLLAKGAEVDRLFTHPTLSTSWYEAWFDESGQVFSVLNELVICDYDFLDGMDLSELRESLDLARMRCLDDLAELIVEIMLNIDEGPYDDDDFPRSDTEDIEHISEDEINDGGSRGWFAEDDSGYPYDWGQNDGWDDYDDGYGYWDYYDNRELTVSPPRSRMSTPSDLFSEIWMPDDFVYDDLNRSRCDLSPPDQEEMWHDGHTNDSVLETNASAEFSFPIHGVIEGVDHSSALDQVNADDILAN